MQHNVEGGYFIDEDIHLYDAAFFKDPAESASVCGFLPTVHFLGPDYS